MNYDIDPEVQRDLLNYLINNDYSQFLTGYHTHILEALTPGEQRACVDHSIRKGYKTIFATGWPKPNDEQLAYGPHTIKYCGEDVTLPSSMTIIEPHKKLKYAELEPFYKERLSLWHDAVEAGMNNLQLKAYGAKLAAQLRIIQDGLIADGALMTEPSESKY